MPLLILFLVLLLGCTTSNDHISGARYSVRKAIYINESYFENISYPEKCQKKLIESGWNYSQKYKECPHLLYDQKDTSEFRLDTKGLSLCNKMEKCLARPDIFVSEEKDVYFSFCQNKFYTKMAMDSLCEIHDFDDFGLEWRGPYVYSKNDSTIVFKGKNGMTMIFFVDENKLNSIEFNNHSRDVTRYLQKPYGIVLDTICTTKNTIVF